MQKKGFCFLKLNPGVFCPWLNLGQDLGWCTVSRLPVFVTVFNCWHQRIFFIPPPGADKKMCHIWLYALSSDDNGKNQPDNVRSCLSFLCQELWVMHHLLQETNYSHLQLCVQLKILRNQQQQCHYRSVFLLERKEKKETNSKKDTEVYCTCECLETQWRSTFRTLFVAALLITNSLSPFLWSVGKPGSSLTKQHSFNLI